MKDFEDSEVGELDFVAQFELADDFAKEFEDDVVDESGVGMGFDSFGDSDGESAEVSWSGAVAVQPVHGGDFGMGVVISPVYFE